MVVRGVAGFSSSEGGFDSINAFISETCDLDICSNFCRLGCETLPDIRFEFLGDNIVGKGDFLPNVRIS